MWIGWSNPCSNYDVKGKKVNTELSRFHACNIEVISLINCTKADHNKSGAIMKAYAVCSQGCITPACVRHCSHFGFSLSLCQRTVFATSQLELRFDKTTCWHVRCKIWRRSDVLVLNKLHWHLHCVRPSKLTDPTSSWNTWFLQHGILTEIAIQKVSW